VFCLCYSLFGYFLVLVASSFMFAVVVRLALRYALLSPVALSLRFFLADGPVVLRFAFSMQVLPVGEGPSFFVVPLSSCALLPVERP
jgi:hypothetical protein